MPITQRQQYILRMVIERYIETAEPVASSTIANESDLGVSSATIRNELAALEEDGYLISPHTSAGRVPTEKGYRFYIATFISNKPTLQKERRQLRQTQGDDFELRMRTIARKLSELTGEAVVLTVGPKHAYKTGISNLLQKPDFSSRDMMVEVGRMMDEADEAFTQALETVGEEVEVVMGSDSPFGNHVSTLTIAYEVNGRRGALSIVGPTRMNYQYNLALLREAQRVLNKLNQRYE